jgi:putative endonuclease
MDGTFYTGITNNLPLRLKTHRAGKGARYTRVHGVKGVVYSEANYTRSEALTREYAIKKLTKKEKNELLLQKI